MPNAWIDIATDSTATWRQGSELQRTCISQVRSRDREIFDLNAKYEQATRDRGREHWAFMECAESATDLQDQIDASNARMRPLRTWSTIGKVAVAVLAVGLGWRIANIIAP